MVPRHIVALLAASVLAAGLAGCDSGSALTADGAAPLRTDTAAPFLLTGVANVTQIAKLTGPDAINETLSVGVAGTDLGSMATIGDETFFFFGDTFGDRDPLSSGGQGGLWRSNTSAVTTDDDPSDGITFDAWRPVDGIGMAGPVAEGLHQGDNAGEVTKIPTYGFAVDDTLYVYYMSVRHWGAAGAWDANYSALAKSTDHGVSWTVLDSPQWPGDSGFIQVAVARVAEGDADYLYFWSIPAGRFGAVRLMRVPAEVAAVEDAASYTYFAGTDADGAPVWSADRDDATVVLDGTVGELSVMWSTYLGRWLMSYSDAGNAYLREGTTPWGPWGKPVEMISYADAPGLYAPFMNPRYVSDDGSRIYFTLSLWDPYNVFWYSADLTK